MRSTNQWLSLSLALALAGALGGCSAGGHGGDGGAGSTPDMAMPTGGNGGSGGGGGGGSGGQGGISGGGGSGGGGASCPSPVAPDPLRANRESCAFTAASSVQDTTGLSDAARAALPIKHVIVMMKENRSFDHIFGGLKATRPDIELFPDNFSNKDKNNNKIVPYHMRTTCYPYDPGHQWNDMHAEVNGGAMDGFVTNTASTTMSNGNFALGYFDGHDLPFYYFLVDNFAIADHYYASVRSGTHPNRDYLLLGTSDGVQSTSHSQWPSPSLPTIFTRLSEKGISWGVYGDDFALEECLNNTSNNNMYNWEKNNPWYPVQDLINAFANDVVPSVVFVDGRESVDDDHPDLGGTADIQRGEAWSRALYQAALDSKAWSSTVIFFTYDEAGGLFDHVPPPSDACVARNLPVDQPFYELGARVPLIAISPWARRHYVSHTRKEHASITRFIETVFGLPALTARDANADPLLDMFDFGCAPPAIAAAPAAGSGGCVPATVTPSKPSYAAGEALSFSFLNGPGFPSDLVAIYPKGTAPSNAAGSLPSPAPTLWAYVASGTHSAGASATDGTVTLAAGSGSWPLAAGTQWTAYFMANPLLASNGAYQVLASAPFSINP